jgi:hypothetical protein
MNKTYLIISMLSCLVISAAAQEKLPVAEITNGLIRAHFYLPDSKAGYYQATRFDWSGIISSLEYDGHSFYGQWFETYSPTTHDAVMGPVEEFAPIGYNEATSGGDFLKIGVGMLAKPDESAYNSFKLYPIANPGKWKIKKKAGQIQFAHKLDDSEYSYEYCKTLKLTKGKPELVLTHTLKNTGKKTIETAVYDHNFLVIDNQIAGPGYVVNFPENVKGTGKGFGEIARLQDNKLIFLRELNRGESVYCSGLLGLGNNVPNYDLSVENRKTGAGVRIRCDQPLLKLVFWASFKTVCPEPYIQIRVEPGKAFSWKISYEYYTTKN